MAGPNHEPLAKYDSMRDFDATPEPPGRLGGSVDGRRRFLVQRHRARRLHYDFRIEVDGVLVPVQIGVTLTVIGSKELPKDTATA